MYLACLKIVLCISKTVVNGQWGGWTSITKCSAITGSGMLAQTRICDHPKPQYGGTNCTGSPFRIVPCTGTPVPTRAKPTPTKQSGTTSNPTTTTTVKAISVTPQSAASSLSTTIKSKPAKTQTLTNFWFTVPGTYRVKYSTDKKEEIWRGPFTKSHTPTEN